MCTSTEEGVTLSGAQLLLAQKKQKVDMKLSVVVNCESVIQSPEGNMSSLRELTKCFESSKYMSSKKIRLLLVASLCVVYKDILPSYHIRPLTELEKSQPMKKETKKIRFFEENLLINYKKYVELLQVILGGSLSIQKKSQRTKQYGKIRWNESDRISALRCACQLLEAHPRFNFSEELTKLLLPFLNDSRIHVSNTVLGTLKTIFSNDREGETTLAICRAIHTFARKKSYCLRPAVTKALSFVPITEVVDESKRLVEKIDRSQKSRRERKKDKIERKHEKEMAETLAAKSHEERVKLNTLILDEILFVYFKVLKITTNSDLLSSVLEGLSVYSNLINVVYVDSLLAVLNRYIEQKETKLTDGLNCVHTALNILNNPGSSIALQTDPTRFYNHLYTLLGRMAGTTDLHDKTDGPPTILRTISANYGRSNTPAAQAVSQLIHRERIVSYAPLGSKSVTHGVETAGKETNTGENKPFSNRVSVHEAERLTDVLLSCLNLLLIRRRRDVSVNRVLAFVKRLASAALAMPDSACTGAMLVLLIRLVHLFPRCEVLFDAETEIGGAYRASVDDPELCLPASACLWELELLRIHPSPTVQALAKVALQWGRIAQAHGANEAVAKTATMQLGRTGLSLEQLIQLGPSDCRAALSEADAAWVDRSQTDVVPVKRKRTASRYNPSLWFTKTIASVGLHISDELPNLTPKRLKLDNV